MSENKNQDPTQNKTPDAGNRSTADKPKAQTEQDATPMQGHGTKNAGTDNPQAGGNQNWDEGQETSRKGNQNWDNEGTETSPNIGNKGTSGGNDGGNSGTDQKGVNRGPNNSGDTPGKTGTQSDTAGKVTGSNTDTGGSANVGGNK